MPVYGLPGTAVGPRGARSIGVVAAAISGVLLIGWSVWPQGDDGTVSIAVLTDTIATGIEVGDDVRLNGVQIGRIEGIEPADRHQRITLGLRRGQLAGLTDDIGMDFTPSNLFGVSEIALQRGTGGRPLGPNSVIDLTGPNAGRARDATIATLLDQAGSFTTDVLTPELGSVLRRISAGTTAFTPLIETIIAITRAIADTQQLPSSFLIGQYGSTLAGLPSTVDGVLRMLGMAYNAEYLRSPEHLQKFNASTKMIENELIPAVVTLLGTSEQYLAGTVNSLVPVLGALARTVPAPDRSSQELGLLLERIRRAMPDTPNGPVLKLNLDLSGVPGLAVPLNAALPAGQGER
ncbi:MlaD family protein [Nocardia sp. KC 131]|uniref:MlaD family protein n=1 Tax=Nocardia arseniciresistens TaxID=3392119 RepID=UPI00398EEA7A